MLYICPAYVGLGRLYIIWRGAVVYSCCRALLGLGTGIDIQFPRLSFMYLPLLGTTGT